MMQVPPKKPFKLSDKSIRDYSIIIDYVIKFLEDKSILQWSKKDIKSFLLSLSVSDATYNKYLSAIRCLFKILAYHPKTEDLIMGDPTFGLASVQNVKTKKKLPLTIEEQSLMLDNCKNARDCALLTTMLSTGLRIHELINLKLSD